MWTEVEYLPPRRGGEPCLPFKGHIMIHNNRTGRKTSSNSRLNLAFLFGLHQTWEMKESGNISQCVTVKGQPFLIRIKLQRGFLSPPLLLWCPSLRINGGLHKSVTHTRCHAVNTLASTAHSHELWVHCREMPCRYSALSGESTEKYSKLVWKCWKWTTITFCGSRDSCGKMCIFKRRNPSFFGMALKGLKA